MNIVLGAITAAILVSTVSCQKDGFTDENRPYKFGFNIEGYQHRYEEKDEKGIIMGEYGFITADGVYHLTVYATDENGNFRILKMKNIKIGLPMDKLTTPVPPKAEVKPQPAVKQVIQDMMKSKMTKIVGQQGCSGCVIPKKVDPSQEKLGAISGTQASNGNKKPATAFVDTNSPGNFKSSLNKEKTAQKSNQDQGFQKPVNSNTPNLIGRGKENYSNGPSARPQDKNIPKIGLEGGKIGGGVNNQQSGIKPPAGTPVANEIDRFTKNNKVMTAEDLMGILYKFNYTLTYHGHHETGNRAGDKEGGYFFNGRDGLGRDVKYIANEFGYQPNITLVDLTPEQTPKEETEKELTKLKGNEFKWYYLR